MTALPPPPRDQRSSALHELRTLVQSFHAVVAIETPEEERVAALVRAAGVDLFIPVHEWTLTTGLRNAASREVVSGTSDPKRLLAHLRGFDNSVIVLLLDLTRHLSDPVTCRLFREVAHEFSRKQSTLVLCADPLEIPPELRHLVTPLDLPLPTAEELREVLRKAVDVLRQTNRTAIQVDDRVLEQMVRHLGGMTLAQARQAVAFAVLGDNRLDESDLREIIARKAKLLRGASAVEFLPPDLNRTELGGFAGLKAWLQRAAVGFSSQARELGLQAPRGVLIVGVQGCGKSLAAKAIAREWRMPLLKFDAAGLYDKFIGESEKNFRRAIATAEAMAPAVLWIDEIEKAMGSGGSSSDADGGLSRRLFGAFLTWLQENRGEVFVVATANDLSALPPELLRKGRFDEIFFVDLPSDDERRDILALHLRLRKQDPANFALDLLSEQSPGYSGAELEQAVVSSLYRALHLKRELDTELLLAELRYIIPLSVSRREDIERLRDLARNRFVNVH
jgi:MoxR-like ATPase